MVHRNFFLNYDVKKKWPKFCFFSGLACLSLQLRDLSNPLNFVHFHLFIHHHIYLHGQLSITKHFCGYRFKGNNNHSKLLPLKMHHASDPGVILRHAPQGLDSRSSLCYLEVQNVMQSQTVTLIQQQICTKCLLGARQNAGLWRYTVY